MNLRRVRQNQSIRNLSETVHLSYKKLIQPLFVIEGLNEKEEVFCIPDVYRDTENSVFSQIESDLKNGITQFILFLVPKNKSDHEFSKDFYQRVVSKIKSKFPEIFLWVDTCLCSVTTHGHCGLFDEFISNKDKKINNQKSVEHLSKLALIYAEAGCDGIAPSDMMDGRVKSHRAILDSNRLEHVAIMSYSTKFKSNFYGPFRAAADSAPSFGDRATYQIDFKNKNDAILSSHRDQEEGADLLMVKPGLLSADLINEIKEKTNLPTGAYQVSGEYASLYLLSKNNFGNFDQLLLETWVSLTRAGSDFIITYGARKGRELI